MATVLSDTAISASNNGTNIFVYFQRTDASVVEHNYRSVNKAWKMSTKLPVAPAGNNSAKIFTPLAANVEVDEDTDSTLRHLYYVDNSNRLREVVLKSDGWTEGPLNTLVIIVAHFSKLAVSFPYLFYQNVQGQVEYVIWNTSTKTWTQAVGPMATEPALLGSGLAALGASVVNQSKALSLEKNGGSAATTTSVLALASPHTSLAAVGDDTYQSILYTTNNSLLKELRITNSRSEATEITAVAPRSNIAAVRVDPGDGDPDVIHVFYQKGDDNEISEHRYTSARGWKLVSQSI